jgi:hypothetical protein
MDAPEEVEADGVDKVGANPVPTLVAAGRGSICSISPSQSFCPIMSLAASSQFRKSEWELRDLMKPIQASAEKSEVILRCGTNREGVIEDAW